jgi:hypothetical protein
MNIRTKLVALGGTAVCIAGLVASASGVTGAFFSQTVPGNITGAIGGITIDASPTTFAWTDMLPGVPNSATVNFHNTSANPENVYLTFPNDTALSALNDLGTYGEVHISTNARGEIFASTNLRDTEIPADTHGCLPYSSAAANPPSDPFPGCNPVRNVVLIASNVPADGTGSFTFQFNYAGKTGNGSSGGAGVFNTFPASATGSTSYVHHADDGDAGHSGNGLPFAVVATQTNAPALVPSN